MIKKTFLVVLVLLTGYSLLVPVLPGGKSLTQWQSNIVKAQRFLLDNQGMYDHVLVGSSLANRINTDSLPGFFNLGLDGLSIYDGLAVINEATSLPGTIYLEMNNVLRKTDERFIHAIRQDFWFDLKRRLPVLREEFKPMVVLVTYIQSCCLFQVPDQRKSREGKKEDKVLFDRVMSQHIQRNMKLPPGDLLSSNFTRLKKQVSGLQSRGTDFFFFIMPVDRRISELPRQRVVKQYGLYYFPESDYRWIFPLSGKEYKTTDGMHLNDRSSREFTAYFRKSVLRVGE